MSFPSRTDQKIFLKTPVNIANIDPSHQPIPTELRSEEEEVRSGELWLHSLQFRETSVDFLSLADQVTEQENYIRFNQFRYFNLELLFLPYIGGVFLKI